VAPVTLPDFPASSARLPDYARRAGDPTNDEILER